MATGIDGGAAGYPGFRVRDPAPVRPTPAMLRRVAHAKLSSVELFSASLRGQSVVFAPWLTTLIDHGGAMRFLGVYRGDPTADQPPEAVGWLAVRRSEWIRDVDIATANRADDVGHHLTAGPQISDRYAFATTDDQTQVVDATQGLVTALARGFTIGAGGARHPTWQQLTIDVADDHFVTTVTYSPLLGHSDVIESLLPSWLETARSAAEHDGIVPDEEISLTIRRSVPEIVNAPYRPPRRH